MATSDCARTVLRSSHPPKHEAFGNTEVVLEPSASSWPYPPGYWHADEIGCHQVVDGPIHLVIGCRASEEQLFRAAERFGVDINTLRAFRDAQGGRRGSVREKGASHV